MREEMIEGINEAISPAFYDYIQEVTGPARLERYTEVEAAAMAAVRNYIDNLMSGDLTCTSAFLSDEEQRQIYELEVKAADRVKAYKEQRELSEVK